MAVHRTNETYEAFQIIQIEDDTDELVIFIKKSSYTSNAILR